MSEAFERYRSLERDLIYIRWQHAGFESDKEETILDVMEEVWYELNKKEQQLLYSEGTKSLIRDTIPHYCLIDGDIWRNSHSGKLIRTLGGVA